MTDINDFDALGINVSSSQQCVDVNYTKSVTVLKRQLQSQLNEKSSQLWMITDLSTAFLKQQTELENRLQELYLTEGDEISQELKDKITEHEKGSRALNENVVKVLKEFLMASSVRDASSTTGTIDERQVLNIEVRHLQAQLQEKDQRIKKLEKSKAKLGRFNEQLNKTIQAYKESEKQLKEENSVPNVYGSKVRHEQNKMNNKKHTSTFNKEKFLKHQSEISICSSKSKNDLVRNIQSPINIDPNIIHVIAKTLIGEYLWKYTRNNFWSRKRHKRFFWIHPYTNILYWSKENPATYDLDSLNLKKRVSYFVYIESVREVVNYDYSSPNLYHTSLVITTPESDLEIVTQSKEQHECWFQ
ncbi:23483_t:CDS:2, partial [Dentiscutata erythropus]